MTSGDNFKHMNELLDPSFDNDNHLYTASTPIPQANETQSMMMNVASMFGVQGSKSAFVVYGIPSSKQSSTVQDITWLANDNAYAIYADFNQLPAALNTSLKQERKHTLSDIYHTLPHYLFTECNTRNDIRNVLEIMLSNACLSISKLRNNSTQLTPPPDLAAIPRLARKFRVFRREYERDYDLLLRRIYVHVESNTGGTGAAKTAWLGFVEMNKLYAICAKLVQIAACTETNAVLFVDSSALPRIQHIMKLCGFEIEQL